MENMVKARTPGEGKQTGTDRDVVAVDYETYYRKGEYSLSNMTVWEYCHDRRFDAYLVSIYGPDISPTLRRDERGMQLYVGRPELFDGWERLRGRILLAHNAAFDSAVTERLIELGTIPELPGCRWCCTADCAGYHCIRRNLANVMKVGFGRDILAEKTKVRDVGMDGRHVEELTPEEYRDLVAYAGHDAVECREVWEKYAIPDGAWYGWPLKEREISERIREACKRGFAVDVAYAEQCLKALKTIRREAEDRIPWTKWHKRRKVKDRMTGEIAEVETSEYYTPLSPVGLRDAVIKAGVKPPSSFAKNDPGFIDWIEHHMDLDFVYARQRYASVNVHIGAIEKLLRMVDPNGIVRPNLTYFGAATGRTSSRVADESREDSDNVNMLNLPRSPIMKGDPTVKAVLEPWYAEMRAKDPEYPEVCTEGVDLRGMYVSRPGYRYVVFDYSQVEARFSLWYVNDTHMMGALKQEGNLYQANAVAMNWCKSGEKIKKTLPDTYRLAKCCLTGESLVLVRSKKLFGRGLTRPRYKSIMRVVSTDWVWDGHEWVSQLGAERMKYVKKEELIEVGGVCLTRDHRVYVDDATSRRADEVLGDEEAAAVAWGQSQNPVQGWAHVWILATALARLGAKALCLCAREALHLSARAVSLHGVRNGGHACVGEREEGCDDQVQRVCKGTCGEAAAAERVGEGAR